MQALATLVAISGLWAAEDLASLERRVAADPENLKIAAEYRQAVIASDAYDRSIPLFERLSKRPGAGANAFLNLALAYVDKVPVSGTLRQLSLGNGALRALTRAIQIAPSPVAYFVRGQVYLCYDTGFFHRVDKGVADLEQAMRLIEKEGDTRYADRVLTALGDGYFRLGQRERAHATWRDALAKYPNNAALGRRAVATEQQLRAIVDAALDPDHRVDTSLRELYPDLEPVRTRATP